MIIGIWKLKCVRIAFFDSVLIGLYNTLFLIRLSNVSLGLNIPRVVAFEPKIILKCHRCSSPKNHKNDSDVYCPTSS